MPKLQDHNPFAASQAAGAQPSNTLRVPTMTRAAPPSFQAGAEPKELISPTTNETTEGTVPSKEDQLSPKFAALARKERALRSNVQAFKAREDALKAREAELQSLSNLKTRLAEDPMSALSELGLSYEDITNKMLNGGNPEVQAYSKLEAEIKALRESQTQQQTQAQETQTKQYEQAVNQIRTDVKLLVDGDPTYETIKEIGDGAIEAVVELIKETHASQGIILDLAEAAEEVENYYVEEAMKYAQLKKVREKLTPPEPQIPAQRQKTNKPQQQPIKTLTNVASTANPPKKLTPQERRARAIAVASGQPIK